MSHRRANEQVVIVGALPPPPHGVAMMTHHILDSPLRERFRFVHVDTSDARGVDNLGLFDLGNVWLALVHVTRFARAMARRPKLAYVPLSRNRFGFLRDAQFLLLARAFRVPTVIHLHARGFDEFYAGERIAVRALIRASLKGVRSAIVLGESRRHEFDGLVPSDRVHVIPNGIPDILFAPRVSPGSGCTVLHLTTLSRAKGTFDVLEAARRTRRTCPGARFALAGPWLSPEERDEALVFIRDHGLEERVTLTGTVSGEAKTALFADADLMLFPTRYPYEAHPLVVLESMAARIPVVASRLGCIPEMIENGVHGLLVPPDDVNALVAGLETALGDPEWRRSAGNRARERYESAFTLDRFTDELESVWSVPDRLERAPIDAGEALRALEAEIVRSDFRGWDPYDALASPVLARIARTPFARRVGLQVVKRLPLNVRPLLGVRPTVNAKSVALSLAASVVDGDAPERRESLLRHLERLRGEEGWSYPFDVQTRWGYYRSGTPNAIVTSFACHASLDAGIAPHDLELPVGFLRGLGREEGWYAYFNGSDVPIHNASVLAASVLSRVGDNAAAAPAIAFTVERQRPDGSWSYGEAPGLEWVDGFHTAYVLEALHRWAEETGTTEADEAIARGLDLYLRLLVDPDGAARHTLGSRYPVDTHALASGITMLVRLRHRDERALPTAERMLDWALRHMLRADGRFAFQQHRLYRNSIPYVRWSDAHMLLALASYLEAVDER